MRQHRKVPHSLQRRHLVESLEGRCLLDASTPDLSFGPGGWTTTEVAIPRASAPVAAISLPGGKLLVAGNYDQGVVRFNADGSLDYSFGTFGRVDTEFWISGMALQQDGKIVLAGYQNSSTILWVSRLDSSGSIDEAFGSGGIAQIPFPAWDGGSFSPSSVQVDSTGRILLNIAKYGGISALMAARLTPHGEIDTSFSGDGFAMIVTPNVQFAGEMVVQGDGKVIVGSRNNGPIGAVGRFDVNGNPDTSFGASGAGLLTLPTNVWGITDLTLDASDRLLLTGDYDGYGSPQPFNAYVARYTPNGLFDSTFNGGGVFTFAMHTPTTNSDPMSIALDGQSRILVGGRVTTTSSGQFSMVRLRANGGLDTSFDGDGRVLFNGGSGNPYCRLIVSDHLDRPIGIGTGTLPFYLLVRTTTAGAMDSSFDGDGIASMETTQGADDTPVAVVEQDDEKLVVLSNGGRDTSYRYYSAVTRFNADGSLDLTFGHNGTARLLGFASGLAMSGANLVVVTEPEIYRLLPNGSLDTSFSIDGKLTIPADAEDVVVDSLGRIYVGGWQVLSRITPGGELDTSFAGDGTLNLVPPGTGSSDTLLKIQSDDQVLYATHGYLWRVRSDGSFDPSFGAGGVVPVPDATSVAVNENGSILVANSISVGTYEYAINLRRLDSFGSLDLAYGVNGVAWADIATTFWVEVVESIAVLSDGTALLNVQLDSISSGVSTNSALVQVLPNGQLDTTFDADGIRIKPVAESALDTMALIDQGGRIVILGRHVVGTGNNATGDVIVARLLGQTDQTLPVLTSFEFGYQAEQSVRLTFSKHVWASIDPGDLIITNISTGLTVPTSSIIVRSAVGGTAEFVFGGVPGSYLSDGNYRVTLNPLGVQDIHGNAMIDPGPHAFFVLMGDANRDRKVDARDLMILANNWFGTGKTFTEGDFNYDGVVDQADLTVMAQRWQQNLAPPPVAPAPAVPTIAGRRAPVRTPPRMIELVQ